MPFKLAQLLKFDLVSIRGKLECYCNYIDHMGPALVQCANVIHVDTVTVIEAPCERAST